MSIPFLANSNINLKPTSNYYMNELTCNIFNAENFIAGDMKLTNVSDQIRFGGSPGTWLNVPAPAQEQIITLPDSGTGTANIIINNSSAAQTINSQLNTHGGIEFRTLGGTASVLNYYEENIGELIAGAWVGDVSGSVNAPCKLVRIGNVVYLRIAECTGLIDGIASYSDPLPDRFRPSEEIAWPVVIKDGASPETASGAFYVKPNGSMNIYPSASSTTWTTSMLCRSVSVCYSVGF